MVIRDVETGRLSWSVRLTTPVERDDGGSETEEHHEKVKQEREDNDSSSGHGLTKTDRRSSDLVGILRSSPRGMT